MTQKYPFLAFTFKGRIKSLIRAEEKFNGYILEYIYEYFRSNGRYPGEAEIKSSLSCFRDLIAYRIVISLPQCYMFKAINNQLINDGCGLFRGRQILPFEHLSRFQNDLI
jgi:hypothetical protein